MRLFLSFLALMLALPAAAQTSIDARRVSVSGTPLTTVLADKPSSTALAGKADKTAVDAALATKAPLQPRNFIVRMSGTAGDADGLANGIATATNSSTISLPAGSITLATTDALQPITQTNLTIQGSGAGSILRMPCGHNGRLFTVSNATRLTIRNLYIDTTTGCPSGQRPTQHTFSIDGCFDCVFENIVATGGYGFMRLSPTVANRRTIYRNINATALEAQLPCTSTVISDGEAVCGRGIEASGGTSQYFENVRTLFAGVGSAGSRAILIKPISASDTWRFNRVVAYSAEGMPGNVQLDFSDAPLANLDFDTSVFDSPSVIGFKVVATGSISTVMSVLTVKDSRIGADLPTGSGFQLKLTNPNAYIKTLSLRGMYISSKDPAGFAIDLSSASTGIARSILLDGNLIGEAVPVGTPRPAAVLIGMDNVRAVANVLSSVKEDAVNALGNTTAFFKATKAAQRVMLIGNQVTLPSATAFLDESAFTLGTGRVVASNWP